MEQTTLDNEPAEEVLRSYLLGKLPEAEGAALEERCFTKPEQYYRLCEAEQALLDDYVRGYLTAADRDRFERYFLTLPARVERVQAARALLARIDGAASAGQPLTPVAWWKKLLVQWRAPAPAWLFAAAASALLVAVGWRLWRENNRLRAELASAAIERGQWQERAQTLAQQIAEERAAHANRNEASDPQANPPPLAAAAPPLALALTAGVLRGAAGQSLPTLKLPRAAPAVQLRLSFTDALYPRYEAVLQTAEGQVRQRWSGLQANKLSAGRARLNLNMRAARLTAGDYLLILKGAPTATAAGAEITRAAFRVARP
jgi:anti-sigma factor RsiW